MDKDRRYCSAALLWVSVVVFGGLFQAAGAAAGPGPEIRVETSKRKAPKWVGRVPKADEEYFYFVGRATGSLTLEGAEQDAAADALRQVVTMIGLTAEVSYERLRREAELLLEDRVSFEGDARVVGLKRLETYYEKIYYHSGDSLSTRYNVSLLLRYPRQSLKEEKARLESEARRRLAMARELLAEGRRYESENSGSEALERYRQALQQLDNPVILLLPAASGGGYDHLRRDLLDAARSLSLKLRRVIVGPVEMTLQSDGRSWQDAQMNAALAQAMLKHGFQPVGWPENFPQGVLLRVSARCREEQASRLGEGFFISRWSAAISLSDPGKDNILAQQVLAAKGFGSDPERALLDARRRLRNEVFAEFALQARKKLDLNLRQDSRERMDYPQATHTKP